jgi:hypothetical protein
MLLLTQQKVTLIFHWKVRFLLNSCVLSLHLQFKYMFNSAFTVEYYVGIYGFVLNLHGLLSSKSVFLVVEYEPVIKSAFIYC